MFIPKDVYPISKDSRAAMDNGSPAFFVGASELTDCHLPDTQMQSPAVMMRFKPSAEK
jgi:hypothetical protein